MSAYSPMTAATLRSSLQRLARGADDRGNALSLLLVMRAVVADRGPEAVVELTSQEQGTLVTLEDDRVDLWVAELLPITMRTIEAVLSEVEELSAAFVRAIEGDVATLRVRATPPTASLSLRHTPIELPSLELLIEAGLLKPRGTVLDPPRRSS
jgi:hypothetical protein